MLHEVVEESLKAFRPLMYDLRSIIILLGRQYLLRDVDDNGSWVMHLKDLDQPLEVVVATVHLLL